MQPVEKDIINCQLRKIIHGRDNEDGGGYVGDEPGDPADDERKKPSVRMLCKLVNSSCMRIHADQFAEAKGDIDRDERKNDPSKYGCDAGILGSDGRSYKHACADHSCQRQSNDGRIAQNFL